MNELINTIALLCSIHGGDASIYADHVQMKCHAYYVNCVEEIGKERAKLQLSPAYADALRICIQKRKP